MQQTASEDVGGFQLTRLIADGEYLYQPQVYCGLIDWLGLSLIESDDVGVEVLDSTASSMTWKYGDSRHWEMDWVFKLERIS